jgi:hypothetical protein
MTPEKKTELRRHMPWYAKAGAHSLRSTRAGQTRSGKTIELDPERARHIDYGYTVETAKQVSADRILLTGESSQLAEQQATLAKLNPNVRELAIYTSDSRDNGIGKELELSQEGFSNAPSLSNASEPSGPSIEVEGNGIGL